MSVQPIHADILHPEFVPPNAGKTVFLDGQEPKPSGRPHLAQELPAQALAAEIGDGIDNLLEHLVLLAETQQGYANLCRLLSAGQLAGQKGQPRLSLGTLAAHAEGLIGLSGCDQGAVPRALLAGDELAAQQIAGRLREILGPDRFWIELQRH